MKELFESALYKAVIEYSRECGTLEDYASAVRARFRYLKERAKRK